MKQYRTWSHIEDLSEQVRNGTVKIDVSHFPKVVHLAFASVVGETFVVNCVDVYVMRIVCDPTDEDYYVGELRATRLESKELLSREGWKISQLPPLLWQVEVEGGVTMRIVCAKLDS